MVNLFQLRMQLTPASIYLPQILALQVRCIDTIVFNFYGIMAFVSKF